MKKQQAARAINLIMLLFSWQLIIAQDTCYGFRYDTDGPIHCKAGDDVSRSFNFTNGKAKSDFAKDVQWLEVQSNLKNPLFKWQPYEDGDYLLGVMDGIGLYHISIQNVSLDSTQRKCSSDNYYFSYSALSDITAPSRISFANKLIDSIYLMTGKPFSDLLDSVTAGWSWGFRSDIDSLMNESSLLKELEDLAKGKSPVSFVYFIERSARPAVLLVSDGGDNALQLAVLKKIMSSVLEKLSKKYSVEFIKNNVDLLISWLDITKVRDHKIFSIVDKNSINDLMKAQFYKQVEKGQSATSWKYDVAKNQFFLSVYIPK